MRTEQSLIIPLVSDERYSEFLRILFDNIRVIPDNFNDINRLVGSISGSAICVGAGPSIYRHKHIKRLAGRNLPVIVSDRMLKYCLRMGLKPTVVCLVDSEPDTEVFFDGLSHDDIANVKFVFNIYGNTGTLKKLIEEDADIFLFASSVHDIEFMNMNRFVVGLFQQRLSIVEEMNHVGALCWVIAYLMGADNIGLVGYDMGYEFETDIHETPHYEYFLKVCKDPYFAFNIVKHDCWVENGKYKTDMAFESFARCMIDIISKSDITTYNCTEGGCLCGKGTPADGKLVCTTLEGFLS